MFKFLSFILPAAAFIALLVYLIQRGKRWCGSCRYFSRNTFPIICESCRDQDKWTPKCDGDEVAHG